MAQLFADNPIFLVPSNIPVVRLGRGNGFPGLWIEPSGNDGTIKANAKDFSRWSLRSARSFQAPDTAVPSSWKPNTEILHDGDEVGLFNHSYSAGGTNRNTKWSPYFAPYAFKKPDDQTIRVWKMEPPSPEKYLDKFNTPENDRSAFRSRSPDWAFLKGGNLVSELLVRDDHCQSSRTTTAGSDYNQMAHLRRYYEPAYLESQEDPEKDVRGLLKSSLWSSSHGSMTAPPPNTFHITGIDYNAGMTEYKTRMKLQSLELLRLKIKFV